jgi:nicotinate phosphoribosyltransferase
MKDADLREDPFGLDYEKVRKGWYTDKYFVHAATILSKLIREGYKFDGKSPELAQQGLPVNETEVGKLEVEMQLFTRRKPFSLVAGTRRAIGMYVNCAGHWDEDGGFAASGDELEIEALDDGERVVEWEPVMHVRGVYRDLAPLETPVLGVLTRATKVATNVLLALEAAQGKPIFFFPARYDIPEAQAADGYAYKVAVETYNRENGANLPLLISTDAQGSAWAAAGSGTVSHSYLLCFLKDTAEAMLHFARLMPPETHRVALVDVNDDCIGDSLAAARKLFLKHMQLIEQGRTEEARKYALYGVRPDTAANMLDRAISPDEATAEDYGVSPKLVRRLREALDEAYLTVDVPATWRDNAKDYFRNIKIVASCGFDPEQIHMFEKEGIPVDVYGVGSYFLRGESNDYTADIVAVKIDDKWVKLAKEGRHLIESDRLKRIRVAGITPTTRS